jgi:hypothetical protein
MVFMHKFLLLFVCCAALAACANEPATPTPSVADTTNCRVEAPTGTNIASRNRCAPMTESEKEAARRQVEAMRAEQNNNMRSSASRP